MQSGTVPGLPSCFPFFAPLPRWQTVKIRAEGHFIGVKIFNLCGPCAGLEQAYAVIIRLVVVAGIAGFIDILACVGLPYAPESLPAVSAHTFSRPCPLGIRPHPRGYTPDLQAGAAGSRRILGRQQISQQLCAQRIEGIYLERARSAAPHPDAPDLRPDRGGIPAGRHREPCLRQRQLALFPGGLPCLFLRRLAFSGRQHDPCASDIWSRRF